MKKISRYAVIAGMMFAGMFSYSCKKSFLDIPAVGALSDDQLKNKAGVESLLIGAYGALDGVNSDNSSFWQYSPDNWIYGSVVGGDAHKGSNGSDQSGINALMTFTHDASSGFLNARWVTLYDGVYRANSVLALIPEATDLTDDEVTDYTAQARFLRGHFYFELKKFFDNVPWIDETTTDYLQPNTTDIWPYIEDDFQYAVDNLPDTQTDVGRANSWAAMCYLAKTYMYEAKYSEAKALYDQIVVSGVTSNGLAYALVEKFSDNFNAATKNNSESVFAVQMTANDGTGTIYNANAGNMLNFPYGDSPFGCCGFYQPSQDLVNSYRTDASGLPYIDTYNSSPVKNDMGIASSESFTPDTQALDPRLDWTVGRRGIPYHDWGNHPGASWIRDQAYAGPYAPKKNVYWQENEDIYSDRHSWAPGSAINVLIIRYADVLLMAAEAEAQLGNLEAAETYVNMIRNRAANTTGWLYTYTDESSPLDGFSTTPAANYSISPYPTGTFTSLGKSGALSAIYFERKLELAMEGHRFFDLSRWGIAQTTMTAYFTYESTVTSDLSGASFTANKNEYFPIPQTQIDLSRKDGTATLTQNTGYN
ncbi:MAG: RagB/SusD family nutrient uptake outer membrane protein [Siphonobacter sp.]